MLFRSRNLGNVERIVRLMLAMAGISWLINQPGMNGVEWFVAIISLFLVLNGVFSRCYLWFVLDVNTARAQGARCR